MPSLVLKSLACVIGLAIVVAAAAPADAAKRKHKKMLRVQTAGQVQGKYRGTHLFPAGPVYNGPDYIGDDPDPNIRFQLQRDLGARYGGDN